MLFLIILLFIDWMYLLLSFSTEFLAWMDCWFMAIVLGSFHQFFTWNCLFNQCELVFLTNKSLGTHIGSCSCIIKYVLLILLLSYSSSCIWKVKMIVWYDGILNKIWFWDNDIWISFYISPIFSVVAYWKNWYRL